MPDQNRAAALVKVGLGQRQRLVDPSPGAPEYDDQGTQTMAVAIIAGLAHHGDDLIDCRRVGRVALALIAWRDPGAEPRHGRRRPATAGSVKQQLDRQARLPDQLSSPHAVAPQKGSSEPRAMLVARCVSQ